MAIPVVAIASVTADALESIEAAVASQRTLEDVVRWGLLHTPPLLIADIVVQDEYTHDVVLPLRSGLFLVYDTTWLGGLTAVAVWDHRPSKRELLDARVARGWSPTPTATRSGPKVLGYAACLVAPHAGGEGEGESEGESESESASESEEESAL